MAPILVLHFTSSKHLSDLKDGLIQQMFGNYLLIFGADHCCPCIWSHITGARYKCSYRALAYCAGCQNFMKLLKHILLQPVPDKRYSKKILLSVSDDKDWNKWTRGMVIYVMEGLDCIEPTVGGEMAESVWVRIKRRAKRADAIVRVYYRPPSQDDNTNELFFKELRDISRSAALVLMGNFNWEYHTANANRS